MTRPPRFPHKHQASANSGGDAKSQHGRQNGTSANLSSNAPQEAGGQPNAALESSKSGEGEDFDAIKTLAAGLYIVSTPIGNLGDITLRAIETLKRVDAVACEDTRVTSVLMRRFGIVTPLTQYHDHNAERVRPKLIAQMTGGGRIALVSDAGTPLLSDPGFKLVRACAEAGVPVVPVPGASALMTALVVAALPTDRVFFAGFLPAKTAARRQALTDVKAIAATLVFYESTQRLPDSLADMATVLGDRPATICRELTKRHEEIRRGTLADLTTHYATAGAPRGEVVVVVGGAPAVAEVNAEDIDAALRSLLATESVRDASTRVAEELRQPRRAIYARALVLARERE